MNPESNLQSDSAPSPIHPAGLSTDVSTKVNQLEQGFYGLRNQFLILLIIIAVFNCSLNVFILKQVSVLHKQIVDNAGLIETYQSKDAPKMNQFVEQLKAFAQNNPDFTPILMKYLGTNGMQAAPAASKPVMP